MRRLTRDRLIALALIIPSVIAIALFVYGFIAFTGYVSLTKWDYLAPDFTLVGLRNYGRLFANPRFQIDLRNMVTLIGLFIPSCLAIGFVLALLLDQRVKGEGLFRSIFLFPLAISAIVTGVVWRWLLAPGTAATGSYGVNWLLEHIGLGFLKSGWYTDPTVLYIHPDSGIGQLLHSIGLGALTQPVFGMSVGIVSLVLAVTWQMSGYTMAMYLAGLRGIPEELREAARIDGADELQVYRYVVLPLLQPITLSAAIILGAVALNLFALVMAMTGPGPGFSTDIPALFMFDTTFRGSNFAQGAGIAVIMLLLVAGLIVPYLVHIFRTGVQP